MRIIENERLKVSIADLGAELSSVYDKETATERIWDANPDVWNRHAPILFPFVGKVNSGKYRIGAHEYEMKTQHGFARDMVFEFVEGTDSSVTHRLLSTEDTLKIYPYSFELLVTHSLDANNPRMLHVTWEVKNTGNDLMYFSIGAHPGFSLPVNDYKERENYYLEFPGRDELTYIAANPANGLATADTVKPMKLENGFVKYYDEIYDTFIFDFQNIETVRIARPDKTPYVTVYCAGFPLLGIWTNPKGGNFICLEPWYGRADNDGFTGTIDEKVAVQKLGAGCSQTMTHSMEFHI